MNVFNRNPGRQVVLLQHGAGCAHPGRQVKDVSTWGQHLPTTTLPQSWLTGLVASKWRQHLPTATLPQSWLTGLVASIWLLQNGASTSKHRLHPNHG